MAGEETGTDQASEEFSVWKKNTPYLYSFVVSHALEWPSLTVQWLPTLPSLHADPSFAVHKLVLGTHTSDEFPNFLMIADALLPVSPATHVTGYPEDPTMPKVEITQKIHVDGEVNRARCMMQNPSLIAAKTSSADVFVFYCTKHPATNEKDGSSDPDLILKGHSKEGYGLSWSPFKEGQLLSGSNDHRICLWDVSSMPNEKLLDAMHVFEGHENVVEDVSWHCKNENLFGSAGDDQRLIIWDVRVDKPQQSLIAHEKEVNYLSFNPYNEWILATASSDTTVGLFDMRKLDVPVYELCSHTEEVFQVEWDPKHETVLASSSDDRRLMVWDLNRIGDEQLEGDGDDGPPELVFSHGGHRAKISDFSFNENEPWVVSSVADDNSLQIWQMARSLCEDEDDARDCF